MESSLIADEGSFRDPAGSIFYIENNVYRSVNEIYRPVYEKLISTGLLTKLIEKEWLIETKESEIEVLFSYKVLSVEKLPFISHPVEWSFSQMKDAALLTLDIFNAALDHDMILKDATAYNIQFKNGKPIFIDTLSFDSFVEGQPWVAYRQFVEHFICPLILFAKADENLWFLQPQFQDGIPVEMVNAILPWYKKLSPSLLMHIVAHAGAKKKYNDSKIKISNTTNKLFSKNYYKNLISNLRSTIEGIHWKNKTFWNDYYESNTTNAYLNHKIEVIEKWSAISNYQTVWDLGSNDGIFSEIFARKGAFVLGMDSDFSAIEQLYQSAKSSANPIHPVLMRLDNPTSSYGWFNKERKTIFERSKPDLVLALALIHHLVITNGLPLQKVVEFFASIAPVLIIEFIPKKDPQIQRLLRNRIDIFNDYSMENFERLFKEKYSLEQKVNLNDSDRVLYFFSRK